MKLGRFTLHLAFGTLILLGFAGATVSAAASNTTADKTSSNSGSDSSKLPAATGGGGSVQGYAADSALQVGTVVQLTGGGTTKVAAATYKNLNGMYGVVVDPHELSLTISNSSLQNEASVATSGTYKALLSSQNGVIKQGDYLTLSAIDGVLMKAGTYEDQNMVFGRAAGSFDGKNNSLGNATLKDTTGAVNKTVAIGLVPVTISIQRNPNQKSTKTNLPPVLQKLGQAIADKPIGPLRMYLSIAITGLSIIVAITTLYSGVRNSIISIGRNPLSKKSIFRGLLEIVLTAFLILIIGLFAVYLLLKL
jgi:hypothetical protein